jgi:hypothetical protein
MLLQDYRNECKFCCQGAVHNSNCFWNLGLAHRFRLKSSRSSYKRAVFCIGVRSISRAARPPRYTTGPLSIEVERTTLHEPTMSPGETPKEIRDTPFRLGTGLSSMKCNRISSTRLVFHTVRYSILNRRQPLSGYTRPAA